MNCKTQTLTELAGEHGLESFHAEFSKLFYILKKVHENERRLTQKCRQLNQEIASTVAKVAAVLEMTQEEELVSAVVRQVSVTRHITLATYLLLYPKIT